MYYIVIFTIIDVCISSKQLSNKVTSTFSSRGGSAVECLFRCLLSEHHCNEVVFNVNNFGECWLLFCHQMIHLSNSIVVHGFTDSWVSDFKPADNWLIKIFRKCFIWIGMRQLHVAGQYVLPFSTRIFLRVECLRFVVTCMFEKWSLRSFPYTTGSEQLGILVVCWYRRCICQNLGYIIFLASLLKISMGY